MAPTPLTPVGSPDATPVGNMVILTPRAPEPGTPKGVVTPGNTPRGGYDEAPASSKQVKPRQLARQNSMNAVRRERRFSLGSRDSNGGMNQQGNGKGKSNETEDEIAAKETHRRQANQFRAKSLRYMQLEDMVTGDEALTRRDVLKQVVNKQRKHNKGCLELPLNILFFVVYAFSARLHEDITNVWLLESALRHRVTPALEHVNTIDDVWSWMKTDMASTFFAQKDYYGQDLPAKDWSRVLLYSQVQGSVRIEQSRDNPHTWGIPYSGPPLSSNLVDFDNTNGGFNSVAAPAIATSNNNQAGGRRMNAFEAKWMSYHTGVSDKVPNDQLYTVSLYPTVPSNQTVEKIQYLEKRRWLDEHTNNIRIVALVLNGELGRPRLEQLSIELAFSRGGGIYNRVDLQAIFLIPFPKGFIGMMGMGVDFLWIVMLFVNSALCVLNIWNAFLESQVRRHLASGVVPMECFIMILGWGNVGGFLLTQLRIDKVTVALQALRRVVVAGVTANNSLSLAESADEEVMSARLHEVSNEAIYNLELGRVGLAWMALVLIFRFFSSFRVQPRLAVVTNTLKAIVTDLAHFLVVFSPTFFAYAISGHFLFGRRLEEFSTVYGAIGVCLRIAFENEFEWLDLSEEFFSTAAIWCWTYLVLVVLIMINMVLAIVLDFYNEVRMNTDSADTIFRFLGHVVKRFRLGKKWVRDSEIACLYGDGVDDTSTLSNADFREAVPKITAVQTKWLTNACTAEMAWQGKQDLASTNYFKVGASIKLSVDEATSEITTANREFYVKQEDVAPITPESTPRGKVPNQSTVAASPRSLTSGESGVITPRRMVGVTRPFPGMPATTGGYAPLMCAPAGPDRTGVRIDPIPGNGCDKPLWYRELSTAMETSSELMEDVQESLQSLHLQWHELETRASLKTFGRAAGRPSVGSLSDLKMANGNTVL